MLRVFRGTADASGAFFHDGLIWVVEDEGQELWGYSPEGGDPIRKLETGLGTEEADLEGCAFQGGTLWFCGSFGRNKKGKRRPYRECIGSWPDFPSGKARVRVGLVDALTEAAAHRGLGLRSAAKHPVKTREGLNVEGLDVHPEGGLSLGLRGPLVEGKAIVLHLINPRAVVEGGDPVWGRPSLWDLGGLGIRSLESSPLGLWIAAGPSEAGRARELWLSVGLEAPRKVRDVPGDLNAEALVWLAGEGLLVLSDDGKRLESGRGETPEFRGLLFRPGDLGLA